jgi:hypothetical protein
MRLNAEGLGCADRSVALGGNILKKEEFPGFM